MEANLNSNPQPDKEKSWASSKFSDILTKITHFEIWTQLAVVTTLFEYVFQRVPLISTPAVILDVGGGFANLFQKAQEDKVKASDVTGAGGSLVSIVGTFAMSASLGIEATLIGAKMLRIAALTTPINIGLFGLGYILDHHKEIKEYVTGPGYDLLKEQYAIALNKFEETTGALKAHLGENLFDDITDFDSEKINQIFIFENNGKLAYNFDYLDPAGILNLKDKLDISATDFYHQLTELNTDFKTEVTSIFESVSEIANPVDVSANSFLTDTEMLEATGETISQDLFLSIDMSDSNLELIHLTKDDLRNSLLYTHITKHPFTHYHNKDLPWLNDSSYFLEVNNKFFHMDHQGINKGMSFPILFDTLSKKPIGLPLDIKGDFIEMNTFDVLQHSPQLFDDPGHVYNNMALQRNLLHKTAIQSSIQHSHLSNNAIQDRIQELQVIKNKDVLKIKNDEIKGLNENIKQNGQTATLSPISGNSREGKYCVRSDDSDESEMIDLNGNNQKIVVEVCFDINQFVFE